MSIDLQFKLKENPLYTKYLTEASYWYKYLNRDPKYFKDFETEMKKVYKLNPSDKISKAIDTVDMLTSIFSALN